MMEKHGLMKEYMTIEEAADYLGVSAMTLRRWDKAGKLHAKRHPMNRYRLYQINELNSLIERIEQSKKPC